MIDLLIKNASVLDGTGSAALIKDVAVQNGKIAAVGKLDELETAETIDASGLTLTPGFIDVHGHSDLFAFVDPLRASKLCQGITTELCGQCGLGPAPLRDQFFPYYTAYFKKQGAPIYPDAQSFTSFSAYLKRMEALKTGVNLAYFIPHGTLRMAAMGLSPAKATQSQLSDMLSMVREGMQAGALGVSSGLMYAPGSFADEAELTAVCIGVGEYGGIYTSHMRNQAELLIESVEETIRVAKNSGSKANISHHKASGKANWGKVQRSSKLIHCASIPCTHDVYPYTAASTTISATLPPKYLKMDQDDFLEHITKKENHSALEKAIFSPSEDFDNTLGSCGYDAILVLNAPKSPMAEGKTIRQYAGLLGIEPFDAYIKLMLENQLAVTYAGFEMDEDDVCTLIKDDLCMFGTDALYVQGMPMTHPRAIGSFPRILGRYVREQHLISLEEAIRKMTWLPAQAYGLDNKGRIEEGYDADMVLFNPETIIDHSDFSSPLLPNEGIERVYVGGRLAVLNDRATGEMNGKLLRAR